MNPVRAFACGLLLLLPGTVVFSQSLSSTEAPILDSLNLYFRATRIYLDTTYRSYGDLNTPHKRDWFNRHFEAEWQIRNALPERLDSVRLIWPLTDSTLLGELEQTKTEIPLTTISPITNEHDTLVVRFTDAYFSITEPRQHLYLIDGGCVIRFTYDCATRQFKVCRVHLWGV